MSTSSGQSRNLLAVALGLLAWVGSSWAQAPQTPVIAQNSIARPFIGPTMTLYTVPLPANLDGGRPTEQEWRFWPQLDGGSASSGVRSDNGMLYLPGSSTLTRQFPECGSLQFSVRHLNDAGSSGWSDAGGPSVWDSVPPRRSDGGSLALATSEGPVPFEFETLTDGCSGIAGYPLYWSEASSDAGFFFELRNPATLASPSSAIVGPGRWRLAVAGKDRADNVGPLSVLDGSIEVLPQPGLSAPTNVRIEPPWKEFIPTNYARIYWDGTPDAAGYVVLCRPSDGGTPLWLSRTKDAYEVALYLADGLQFTLWVSAFTSDGGVSPWAQASAPVTSDSRAPTPPSNLQASLDAEGVLLSWAAATDTISGVEGYRAEGSLASLAGGWTEVCRTASLSCTLPVESGQWRYRVRAVDRAGNLSLPSLTASLDLDLPLYPTSGGAGAAGEDGPVALRLGCGVTAHGHWVLALAAWPVIGRRRRRSTNRGRGAACPLV